MRGHVSSGNPHLSAVHGGLTLISKTARNALEVGHQRLLEGRHGLSLSICRYELTYLRRRSVDRSLELRFRHSRRVQGGIRPTRYLFEYSRVTSTMVTTAKGAAIAARALRSG